MVAAPFILIHESDHKTIVGYYTLSAFSINIQDLPEDIIKKLPTYPMMPVTLLGRLAVDRRYQRQGAGIPACKRAPASFHAVIADCGHGCRG